MQSKWNTEKERLPLSREAVSAYKIPDSIFEEGAIGRTAVIDSIRRARELAFSLNQKGNEISAAEIYATALLMKSYGLIYSRYTLDSQVKAVSKETQSSPFTFVQSKLAEDPDLHLNDVLLGYRNYFTDTEKMKEGDDFQGFFSDGAFVKEMISIDLLNSNPALNKHKEIFDDSRIKPQAFYCKDQKEIKSLFQTLPFLGEGENSESLIDFLFCPIKAHPHSLVDQLKFAAEYWRDYLGDYLLVLVGAVDFITEETKPRFSGPGEPQGVDFSFADKANYSQDSDWMPRVVLLAKNALVWLDQLSKKYDTRIETLADIPDIELDLLVKRGFSSLWLIGIWNRSKASRRIKIVCGNPEAEASAYSLYDYEISGGVGGDLAFRDLDERCKARGIRLASDMVPNHTGMDSKWVREHPDYFLGLNSSPMPQYSFNGEDLCEDPNTQIFLEDHYYDKSDCAVIFKRRDVHSGEERYIYHGNDGTAMPWNDTAQINFLNPEAREAVIQEILNVARKFSVIRFDAAMTLAKKHIQRLWFPEPGSGGDIPTRSEYAMSRSDFEKAIPEEFWQEVVNRIAQEVPNTLLLAEAFWMMEGYFVRNLGMHRVYNSAFMNMLKMELNKDYRDTVKKTLSYDEQILKRYVNFMNNPDEDTAVAQFGKGDKYFGVCVLLSTMPGLPMVGHGQLEGFEEKYGMEYRKAYWDESQDDDLMSRHESTIFPLLKKRAIFSEVEEFSFFDFYTPEHLLNENVFAYSNNFQGEKSLVLYNNSVEETSGWIKESVSSRVCVSDDESYERTSSLWSAFGLTQGDSHFCIFKEIISGLWYIRYSDEILHGGLYFELNGYEANVFLSISEVEDFATRGLFKELHCRLGGHGSPDIFKELRALELEPIYRPLDRLLGSDFFVEISAVHKKVNFSKDHLLVGLKSLENIFKEINDVSWEYDSHFSILDILKGEVQSDFKQIQTREILTKKKSFEDLLIGGLKKAAASFARLPENLKGSKESITSKHNACLFGLSLVEGDVLSGLYIRFILIDLFKTLYGEEIVGRWDLVEKLDEFFPFESKVKLDAVGSERGEHNKFKSFLSGVVASFDSYGQIFDVPVLDDSTQIFLNLYSNTLKDRIGINLFDGKLWFNKELFETEIKNVFVVGMYLLTFGSGKKSDIKLWVQIIENWLDCADQSDYLIDNLLSLV